MMAPPDTPPDIGTLKVVLDRLNPDRAPYPYYNALRYDDASNPGGMDGGGYMPPKGRDGLGNLFALGADVFSLGSWMSLWVPTILEAATEAASARDAVETWHGEVQTAHAETLAARDAAFVAAATTNLPAAHEASAGQVLTVNTGGGWTLTDQQAEAAEQSRLQRNRLYALMQAAL